VAVVLKREAEEVIALAIADQRTEAAARLRLAYPTLRKLSNDLGDG
jgi:hypothetical protein